MTMDNALKITLMTTGSRGDVQPFVALGLGLQEAGYDVTLCTAELFQHLVEGHGLRYAIMDDEMIRLSETPQGRAAVESGGNPLRLINRVKPMIRRMLNDEWAAAQGTQAIVYHPKTLGAYHIAEALDIPAIMSLPLPLYTPTRAFINPILPPGLKLGGLFNQLSYAMIGLVTAPYSSVVNDFRQAVLGLPRRSRFANDTVRGNGKPVPVMYSYSPHVLPVPADWPGHIAVTGYWFLQRQEDWQPPADLLDFLGAGPAPIYIGFGSMSSNAAPARTRLVLEALKRAGQRAVLATGWGAMEASADASDEVYVLKEAPHDWLFPHMAGVVHHGGAGTTAAGLRAGKPTLICPFMGDQPFWGQRVYELGIGPAPIPQKRLTAAKLGHALRLLASDHLMQMQAAALGEQIRAEDGVATAIKVIKSVVGA